MTFVGRWGAAAVTTAAALALAACAGPGTSPDVPADDQIEAFIDAAWTQAAAADVTANTVRTEELVEQCMAEAGFDYVPMSDDQRRSAPPTATDLVPGTREFAQAYGYGVVVAQLPEESSEPDEPWVDPNASYVAALSPSEQDAYWVALDGVRTDGTQTTLGAGGEWQYDWRQAGCHGWAQNQVYGQGDEGADGVDALQAELEQARLAAEADPRLADLETAWAACMSTAGHPGLSAVGDAEAAIREQVDALWLEAWSALPAEPTEADAAAVERGAQAGLSALARQEVVTALADLTCREEVAYDAERLLVINDYQQRFYRAHRVELEAWTLAPTGSGG